MSRFRKAEPVDVAIKALLMGPEGTGKTRAALGFPNVVFIDTEGGTDLFARKYAFDVFNTKSMTEAIAAVEEAIRAEQYQTIAIDSITSLYSTLVNAGEGKQRDGSLSMKQWAVVNKTCGKLIDLLMYKTNQNVVACAWVKEKYAKAGTVVNGREVKEGDLISLGEQADFSKKIGHAFDFVFRMDNVNGYVARVIKARGDMWPAGFELKIPKDGSFYEVFTKALAEKGVTLKGSGRRSVQTDEEAAVADAALFDEQPKNKAEMWAALKYEAGTLIGSDVRRAVSTALGRLVEDDDPLKAIDSMEAARKSLDEMKKISAEYASEIPM